MAKQDSKLVLVLEWELGNVSEFEDDGVKLDLNHESWEETFYQADLIQSDFKVVGVKIV